MPHREELRQAALFLAEGLEVPRRYWPWLGRLALAGLQAGEDAA
jgi:hypothetical protein